ncbi:MAG: polysaccharide pyruvyl transferase family protein [Candidatus Azobacteroides sp.]|nr:polysaccharide pyruvyl transferase family protein [Candidatus Azobacteroides sp.]
MKEIAIEHQWNLEIYLINPEYGEKKKDSFKIGKETIEVTNLYPVDFSSVKSVLKLFATFSKTKDTLSTFKKIDYVLNIGAGDSFSDIYGIKRFKDFNNQNKFAFIQHKPLLLLPQTIGPFFDPHVKNEAIKTINKANVVLARDKQSHDFLKNETKQSRIDEIIDVAFFMPYKKRNFSGEYTHVGLNVSALLWHGGYTQNNQFGLKSNYQKLIHSIIEYYLSLPHVKLHLIPHVLGSNYSVENDYAVSYELIEKYNTDQLVLSPLFLTPILAKNYIAGMDFFMGARMHAAIAAFSSGVPVYPMAYSRKFNGLFADTLDYSYMGDMLVQSEESLLKEIKEAFEKRMELKSLIQDRLKGKVEERKILLKNYLIDFLKIDI